MIPRLSARCADGSSCEGHGGNVERVTRIELWIGPTDKLLDY